MSVAYLKGARDHLRRQTLGPSLPATPREPVRTPPLAWLPPAVRARLEALPLDNIVAGVALLNGDPLLPPALELAGELGATLHLVHAFDPPASHLSSPLEAGSPDAVPPEHYSQLQEERLWRAVPPDSQHDGIICHAVEGVASECLEELVRETGADLLILGADRRPGSSGRAVGSTAYRLIRALRVPVLVLGDRAGGEAGKLRPATLFSGPAQPTISPGAAGPPGPAATLTVNASAGAAEIHRSAPVRARSFPPEAIVPNDPRAQADHLTPRRSKVP